MPKETQHARDLKKTVGSPKIIFVLGGPATGKGTQCAKLVEEFGYQHLSTGDLLRAEMDKGTPEGQDIKRLMAEGALVPNQLTIQLLVKAMMSRPSKNYLIDGFPRSVEQAVYFEQNVLEAQQVLYFDAPKELMLERCLKRAETSGRVDDHADILQKRVQTFLDQSYPVVAFYEKFGKVSRVDATGGVSEVAALTKAAVLPQTMFLLGQKASGKSAVAMQMADRTNMKHLDYLKWIQENGLEDEDDETACLKLIQALAEEQKPRVMLESFPQNVFQAKFFLRNCVPPSNVFYLACSIDVSQARMNQLSDKDPNYVSSVQLSQEIKAFGEASSELIPFLREQTNFAEINTEGSFEKTMELVNAKFEPCVIHVRPGAKSDALRKEITNRLCAEHGFINVDVPELIRGEISRKTPIGLEMHGLETQGRPIPADLVVRMLQKIVYSGCSGHDKFILTNFPESTEQVVAFETDCAKIRTVLYSTTDDPVVEIAGNNLGSHNIDTQFQKEFRLQTMNCWDFSVFQEKLGNKVEYGVLLGQAFSGKTTLAAVLKAQMDFEIIDMKAISEVVRESLKTEDGEPFEGDIPMESVEKEVAATITKAQASSQKCKFLFDGFTHKNADDFIRFLDQFGMPSFVLKLNTSEKYLKERFCKKAEVEEFPEDQLEVYKEQQDSDSKAKTAFDGAFAAFPNRCTMLSLNTDASLETTTKALMALFSPQVVIVNHEKRLDIDTACANLALKYNMLYISAYQVIAEHVQNNTKWGQLLQHSKRSEAVSFEEGAPDDFNEGLYAPSLYDQKLVLDLMRATIQEKRTNQKYVLLEGFCKASKLAKAEDKLEVRLMDELFAIEKHLGEVKAVIGLQDAQEDIVEKNVQYLDTSDLKKEVKEAPKPEEGEEQPEGEGGEAKPPAFDVADYKWTITNKKPKNLPHLFIASKGKSNTKHEIKNADSFGHSEAEAITKALDYCCNKAQAESCYYYGQVIFQK